MYILKNALKSIGRSKGRNFLIGIIVLVISVSTCVGLSIRQASESAKEETLNTMSVNGTITFDRQSLMSSMTGGGGFDRSQFSSMMSGSNSLSLEEYEKYAQCETVSEFSYTMNLSINGSDCFEPVSTDAEESAEQPMGGMMSGRGGMSSIMGMSGDFQIVGCSSESAMTSFIDGSAYIGEGEVFAEGTSDFDCIISQELATFNDLNVGDTIEVSNPKSDDEIYHLQIAGIYVDSSANENSVSNMGMATSSDPANKIYMSYTALQKFIDESQEVSVTEIDEDTGTEYETGITGMISASYEFANADDYYQFENDVRNMGLDESYIVSSSDLSSYEDGLMPLDTLSTMAGWFVIVILIIGAVILVVLNIFNVRERKYEIGVLAAMGMKKGKVTMQLLSETFIVTITFAVIGIGIGAATSVPVTNALLENQVSIQQTKEEDVEENFGRSGMMGMGKPGNSANPLSNIFGSNSEIKYVTEISSAMNITVVMQMLLIAVVLTHVSGAVSMLFVMRYEPLKILANRD